jgi:hypothetical protein
MRTIYKDDSQIVRLHASKDYLLGKNARSFVKISVECIGHDSIVPIHDHGEAGI